MTPRQVMTVNVDEILALEIRCPTCGWFVSVPIIREPPIPLKCGGCKASLLQMGEAADLTAPGAADALFRALKGWGQVQKKPCQLTFTLELPPK